MKCMRKEKPYQSTPKAYFRRAHNVFSLLLNCPEHFLRYWILTFDLFQFFSGIRQFLHPLQFICSILQAKMRVGIQCYANIRMLIRYRSVFGFMPDFAMLLHPLVQKCRLFLSLYSGCLSNINNAPLSVL